MAGGPRAEAWLEEAVLGLQNATQALKSIGDPWGEPAAFGSCAEGWRYGHCRVDGGYFYHKCDSAEPGTALRKDFLSSARFLAEEAGGGGEAGPEGAGLTDRLGALKLSRALLAALDDPWGCPNSWGAE